MRRRQPVPAKYKMVKLGIVWIFLGVGCVYDLLYKKIPLFLVLGGGCVAGILAIAEGIGGAELLYALLPGVCLMAAAFFSREKVGYGDGLFLLVLGLLEGGKACIRDLFWGLLLLAVVGLVLLVLRKARKDKEIPFIPFLLTAHVLSVLPGI